MKRIAIILFFMVFFTGVIYCQLFDNTPVSTKDIERGLYDIEYFRKVLLEHGFKYDSQSKDENGISESWCYKRFLENVGENYVNPYPVIHFQISTWIRDGKPWSKAIYVYIYKELYAKYAEEFFNDIRKSYPVKKVQYGFKDLNNRNDTIFSLNYTRIDSNVIVEVDDSFDVNYEFTFQIYL